MPTSAISLACYVGALATFGGLTAACRGNLPPTEPRRLADKSTNDAAMGPLTSLNPAAAGSGGTNVLPIPSPGPGGGGMGGAAPSNAP